MRKSLLSALLVSALSLGTTFSYAAPPAISPTPPSAEMKQTSVNLNTADAPTLQRELSGIGLGKAQAIVAFREANGAFTSVDELLEVKGIGKALLDRNRERLSIN